MFLKQYRTIEQMCSDVHSITLMEDVDKICPHVDQYRVMARWVGNVSYFELLTARREFEPRQELCCFLKLDTLLSLLSTGLVQGDVC